jgi:hypothetical protein
MDHYYTLVNFYLEQGASGVDSIDTSDTTFIDMTPTIPTTGNVEITASLSATGTPDNTKFLRGDNFWARANETYTFVQAGASATWTVQHNLDKFPSVTMVLSTGQKGYGDIVYIDENNLTITFASAESGKAYMN